MMDPASTPILDIVRRKRDGRPLAEGEISAFVAALTDGSLQREQAAAMAMAIYLNGMDFAETAALTRRMTASGAVIDWAAEQLNGPVLDKHSTGGVGDKVSLMLAPIVAACGGYVPMVAGRGLGHTGGTIDKLASVPRYTTHPGLNTFRDVVRMVGCAIIGQTAEIAPADRMLYAIRDVTATIESTPLITASILSKKLAAGVGGLVMDIKMGSGAFMATASEASGLGSAMGGTAAAMGLPMRVLITDMDQPLGRAAGNALEVREAIYYLKDDREPRLDQVTLALAAEMLELGGLVPDRTIGRERADQAVRSGKAAEIFARMIAALGGPADLVERPERHLARAPVSMPVFAEQAGYLARIDTRAIGEAIIDLGGGRRRIDDAIDPAVGYSDIAPIGAEVGPDRPLAIVHAASREAGERGLADYGKACIVTPERPDPGVAIHAVGEAGGR